MKQTLLLAACMILLGVASCKKSKDSDPVTPNTNNNQTATVTPKQILLDEGTNVIINTYTDLQTKITTLYNACVQFSNTPTDPNLGTCKQAWKDARQAWEQCEGFLFGPVETDNIDPHIDTWPVNFARIDSVLSSASPYTSAYINALEDGLKGFHPVEYLLFGSGGNKMASQFAGRQKELLIALATNIQTLTQSLAASWNPQTAGNYYTTFTTAGTNSVYPTVKDAYTEMLDAMIDIADEVGDSKMKGPFVAQDPSLEESPFASNSIKDFTDNIISVQNIYLGKYGSTDGKGLEDLIKPNNLSMDGTIKQKISAAITSLGNITVPFGQAITTQQTQVQNAINAMADLKSYLENTVKPYVQLQVQ
ncbi:MAG: imelysin family protein [Bacteroidia bacterium]